MMTDIPPTPDIQISISHNQLPRAHNVSNAQTQIYTCRQEPLDAVCNIWTFKAFWQKI